MLWNYDIKLAVVVLFQDLEAVREKRDRERREKDRLEQEKQQRLDKLRSQVQHCA